MTESHALQQTETTVPEGSAAPPVVQDVIGGQSVQPGRERVLWPVLMQVSVDLHENLVDQILDLVLPHSVTPRDAGDQPLISGDQLTENSPVALENRVDDPLVLGRSIVHAPPSPCCETFRPESGSPEGGSDVGSSKKR